MIYKYTSEWIFFPVFFLASEFCLRLLILSTFEVWEISKSCPSDHARYLSVYQLRAIIIHWFYNFPYISSNFLYWQHLYMSCWHWKGVTVATAFRTLQIHSPLKVQNYTNFTIWPLVFISHICETFHVIFVWERHFIHGTHVYKEKKDMFL